jgi:hypothetical protein
LLGGHKQVLVTSLVHSVITNKSQALTVVPCLVKPRFLYTQLADSSPLKRELVEGVDILIVRELVRI